MARSRGADLLSVAEVAAELGVDATTVRRWIAGGDMPAERVGVRAWAIRRSTLEAARANPPGGRLVTGRDALGVVAVRWYGPAASRERGGLALLSRSEAAGDVYAVARWDPAGAGTWRALDGTRRARGWTEAAAIEAGEWVSQSTARRRLGEALAPTDGSGDK